MVSAELGEDGGAYWALRRVEDGNSEMMVLICSPAVLSKRVGAVIPSGVKRFVGAVCLNRPGEQEVPLVTNCSTSLEIPVYEVLTRERRDGRVRDIDGIEGVGAVRANIVAAWWTVVVD